MFCPADEVKLPKPEEIPNIELEVSPSRAWYVRTYLLEIICLIHTFTGTFHAKYIVVHTLSLYDKSK